MLLTKLAASLALLSAPAAFAKLSPALQHVDPIVPSVEPVTLPRSFQHHDVHPMRRHHRHKSHTSHPLPPLAGHEPEEDEGTCDSPEDNLKPPPPPPKYVPTYKRKAANAHADGNTCHHFRTNKHLSPAMKAACSKRSPKHPIVPPPKGPKPPKPDHAHHKDHDAHHKAKHNATESPDDGELSERGYGSYRLVKQYSGNSFFDDMHFFTDADPSGGMVTYVDKDEAYREGLIGVKNGNALMRIGHGDNGIQRSVRISSSDTFTSGVFILDAYHMPTGCGVWPAFWTTPANPVGGWPNGGEIDVIEGVHYFSRNMYSIHAPSSCSMPEQVNMLGELAMPDKILQRNCDPNKTDDQGCGVKSKWDGDYGHQYNIQGGGVHALVWDSNQGISMYFFPRNAIPGDIQSNNPNPAGWGTPRANWPANDCSPDEYFQEHVAVFSNTVCGTWAGSEGVWQNKQDGQEFSCAEHTGASSCWEYMMRGGNLNTAHWEIASLKIYQQQRRR